MTSFQSHFERLELKFLIDEILADRLRSQILGYCTPDRNSAASRRAGGTGYAISSLYLDTPALAFHAAKERGDPDRVKLRVRTYSPTSRATLEVKRRRSNVIDKRRVVVDRECVADAARGLIDPDPSSETAEEVLEEFAHIMASSGADPKLSVSYEREAYESQVDPYARVTFDRNIRVRPTYEWELCPDDQGWCPIDEHWRTGFPTDAVVLELKCETAVPQWMIELIRRNELEQTSFSKYSVGICLTQWLQGGDVLRSRSLGSLG
jgi:hypothetical protein